jgi:hypothetical protein
VPGQYEIRYLKDDGFSDVAVMSHQIERGTVDRHVVSVTIEEELGKGKVAL